MPAQRFATGHIAEDNMTSGSTTHDDSIITIHPCACIYNTWSGRRHHGQGEHDAQSFSAKRLDLSLGDADCNPHSSCFLNAANMSVRRHTAGELHQLQTSPLVKELQDLLHHKLSSLAL